MKRLREIAVFAIFITLAACKTPGTNGTNGMTGGPGADPGRPVVETPEQIEQILGKRGCGTMIGYRERLRTDIEFRRRREQIERDIRDYIADNADSGSRSGIVIIPVVVHVVHNTAVPAQNVSDALINSQIAVLNADFRRTNGDFSSTPAAFQPLAADARIQFQLARRDPNCQPTTGITRTTTTQTSFVKTGHPVKFTSSGGRDAWPRDRYLNLWVCNLSGSLLGYSSFPGDPANIDGVVIDYQYFGTPATDPFDLGRTATHEIGHWLNLNHIWGDDQAAADTCSGTDNVADTPNQDLATNGCKTFPDTSCSNGPNGDLFMNYMDYSDDDCMYMFSAGQSLRMDATLYTTRALLAGSDALLPPPPGSTGGADLFSQDTAEDIGVEPNTVSPFLYISDDIWVRNQDDGITNQEHQNPEYRPSTSPNKSWVYVRVRNRGCTGTASGTVKLYWAKASTGLSWPAPWDGSVTTPALMGQPLGAQPTGAVAAGGFTIVKFEWRPPNPADYASFGADRTHFCLLSRIETSTTSPFGMTTLETTDLGANVRENNNIVWKNIQVADDLAGDARMSAVLVANYTDRPMTGRLQFEAPRDGSPNPFANGTVIVDLGPQLFAKWRSGQGVGRGIEPLEGTKLLVTNGAVIDNLPLQPGELYTIQVEFDASEQFVNANAVYAVDVQQYDADRFIGGQRFIFKTRGRTTRPATKY